MPWNRIFWCSRCILCQMSEIYLRVNNPEPKIPPFCALGGTTSGQFPLTSIETASNSEESSVKEMKVVLLQIHDRWATPWTWTKENRFWWVSEWVSERGYQMDRWQVRSTVLTASTVTSQNAHLFTIRWLFSCNIVIRNTVDILSRILRAFSYGTCVWGLI